MKSFIVLLLGLAAGAEAASTQRGTWFWGSGGDPWGSTEVVGDAGKEATVLANFSAHGISHVYGSYGNRPVSELSTIADWNASLNVAGITSELLLAENSWLDPLNHGSLTDKIQDRLLTFNNTVAASEQFQGLHLDIEPQALAGWGAMTGVEKRDELYALLDVYEVARDYLDANGGATITLAGDLPVWFDSSPSIAWTDDAERDAWFADVASVLDSVSLMPFDRDTFSSIDSGVSWELANMSGAEVRVGLEVDIPGTWADMAEFWAMADTIEGTYGEEVGIDIQSYANFAAQTIPEPGVWALLGP
ncbi:MAG: hypothetical protein ACQKBY_05710, partial [Verrucomicrobiales bacterium]